MNVPISQPEDRKHCRIWRKKATIRQVGTRLVRTILWSSMELASITWSWKAIRSRINQLGTESQQPRPICRLKSALSTHQCHTASTPISTLTCLNSTFTSTSKMKVKTRKSKSIMRSMGTGASWSIWRRATCTGMRSRITSMISQPWRGRKNRSKWTWSVTLTSG